MYQHLAIAVFALVIAGLLTFPLFYNRRPKPAKPQDDGRTAKERADSNAMNKGICPDCDANGSLCAGPSGGMSQNVACDQCHMEFNVHFGFGTGALGIDRTGKLSPGRARSAFGIDIGHPE